MDSFYVPLCTLLTSIRDARFRCQINIGHYFTVMINLKASSFVNSALVIVPSLAVIELINTSFAFLGALYDLFLSARADAPSLDRTLVVTC